MSCLKEDVCISIIFIRISENFNLTVLGPVFQDFFSRCERVFQRMLVFKEEFNFVRSLLVSVGLCDSAFNIYNVLT